MLRMGCKAAPYNFTGKKKRETPDGVGISRFSLKQRGGCLEFGFQVHLQGVYVSIAVR